MNKNTLELLKGVTFAISILGFITGVITNSYPFSQGITLIIVLALASIYSYIAIWGDKFIQSHHKMGEDSMEEEFFQRWYSKSGELKIFCDDLKWLDGKDTTEMALQRKGEKLHIYLRDKDDEIVDRLFSTGASIYMVKDEIQSNHRFSLLKSYGIKSVIIRNKQVEKTNQIEFEEYIDHQVLYDLADDMLADCFHTVYHRSTHSKLN